MRWIGVPLLMAGCATGGEVSQARMNHLNCLDQQIADVRAAKSMFQSGLETRATAAECWRVFQSQVQAGQDAEATAIECRQLDGYAQDFHDRTAYYDARVAQTAASCRELAANAERLAAERDRERAAESVAKAYGDVPPPQAAQAVDCSRGDWGTCKRPAGTFSAP
jgi:hypothetical protein